MTRPLHIDSTRETIYFDDIDGTLRQRIEVDLRSDLPDATSATLTIRSRGETAATTLILSPGASTHCVHAPVAWPKPADAATHITVKAGEHKAEGKLTVGSHRPWTIYLLSDVCCDDAWAFGSLEAHDRADYMTTATELSRGTRYNFTAVYQVERFMQFASKAEQAALKRGLREGRLHLTPVPTQFLTNAYPLSAYSVMLEPYRDVCAWAGSEGALSHDAYHMEAPTWSAGYGNLLACAGFRSFTKSMLLYQSPWLKALESLPRLMRWEVAPGREMLLLLRVGDYWEGIAVRDGAEALSKAVCEQYVPAHEALGKNYPLDVLPLVGAYGDNADETHCYTERKQNALGEYAARGHRYPRVIDATSPQYFDAVEAQLHAGDAPLLKVRGDTGASWEMWPNALQAEWAAVRRAARDVISLRTLAAMRQVKPPAAVSKALHSMARELVNLSDHAWNGHADVPGVGPLNIAIRRRRLNNIAQTAALVRKDVLRGAKLKAGAAVSIVNTLGWKRACRVALPPGLMLIDAKTGKPFAVQDGFAVVSGVPAFGARDALLAKADGAAPALSASRPSPLPTRALRPVLFIGNDAHAVEGGWQGDTGRWTAGPFAIDARLVASTEAGAVELVVSVTGAPPDGYELCWQFDLPWKRAIWRGDSGGSFTTPGPTGKGGDSLLGIAGSVFAAGEGLSARSATADKRIDFAFDQSGLCGLGKRTTLGNKGLFNIPVQQAWLNEVTMRSCATDGYLLLYLLSDLQNKREALLDQGGARAWQFRVGLRAVDAGFDDVSLYQFAASFNRDGELAAPGSISSGDWLSLGGHDIIVLGASRRNGTTEIDLYNTAKADARTVLRGAAVEGTQVQLADMLGCNAKPVKNSRVKLQPLQFAKVIVSEA